MHSFCAVRLPNSLLLSPLDTQSNEKIIQNLELYTAIHQLTVMYLALKCPFLLIFFVLVQHIVVYPLLWCKFQIPTFAAK